MEIDDDSDDNKAKMMDDMVSKEAKSDWAGASGTNKSSDS